MNVTAASADARPNPIRLFPALGNKIVADITADDCDALQRSFQANANQFSEGQPCHLLGRAKLTPLGESGGALGLEDVSA